MKPLPIQGSLNNAQLEILKLFTRELDEQDLLAIKRMIVKYLASKVTTMADQHWEEQGWTNKDMDRLLELHERTSYNLEN